MGTHHPATDGTVFEHILINRPYIFFLLFSLLSQISVKSVQITVQTLQA